MIVIATAQSVINSARYDLIDYVDGVGVGIEFDDAELLNYLNRMISILDSTLSSLNSDLVEAKESDIDTVSNQAYIDISGLNSGLWSSIRSVWIGSDRLTKISLNELRYTSMFRSGVTKPTEWTLYNQQILFPQASDDAYTNLVIYYNKKTGSLALTGSMPYFDIYNEFLREMLVLNAKAKKEGLLSKADTFFSSLFKMRVMQEEISRGFIPKEYNYTEF